MQKRLPNECKAKINSKQDRLHLNPTQHPGQNTSQIHKINKIHSKDTQNQLQEKAPTEKPQTNRNRKTSLPLLISIPTPNDSVHPPAPLAMPSEDPPTACHAAGSHGLLDGVSWWFWESWLTTWAFECCLLLCHVFGVVFVCVLFEVASPLHDL